MVNTSESIDAIALALAKAQGAIHNVARDQVADTGQYSYSYADLGQCLDAIRKPLADNELAVLQSAVLDHGDVAVRTRIVHSSGQWIDFGQVTLSPSRPGPQAIGSCITYARRYALAAAVGLAQTDDDAASAMPDPAEKPGNSMAQWISRIDSIEDGDYELFKATWVDCPKAVREEISKRKPRLLEVWKTRFKGESNATETKGTEIDRDAVEDGTQPADQSGRDPGGA